MHHFQYVGRQGLNRPRSVRETKVIEIDPESNNESDCDGTGTGYTGEEELPSPRKTKRLYTMPQKKRVVAVARQESIVAAAKQFEIPRTTIDR